MIVKAVEIRDRMTFIPALAILMTPINEAEKFLAWRCGFLPEAPNVLLIKLSSLQTEFSPHQWGETRTMRIAHEYLYAHFSELKEGDVIDVEYILGETTEPKKSERQEIEGDPTTP